MRINLLKGNNLETLKTLADNSVDSVVTDPPYGLSFMGKKWDYDVPSVELWKEVYRVLKPGGHLLSFGGTRTYHKLVSNIEDAGFEIRDQIMWIYGSGFPKSLNIGKAFDKMVGNEREVVGVNRGVGSNNTNTRSEYKIGELNITKGSSPYEGFGTALKPANEPICVARKPISENTIVENVMKWGTGGINIDGCRIGNEVRTTPVNSNDNRDDNTLFGLNNNIHHKREETTEGRFPANIIFECTCDELLEGKEIKSNENYNFNNVDLKETNTFKGRGKYTPRTETPDIHTDPNCPCYILDKQSGISKSNGGKKDLTKTNNNNPTNIISNIKSGDHFNDKGGASRFFYVAKVSKKERNLGLDGFEDKITIQNTGINSKDENGDKVRNDGSVIPPLVAKNHHPTLKPINLMTYLCRLVTPKGGVILDPFMGSGSTGISALLEGFDFIGCELDEEYFKIAEARINSYEEYRKLLK